MTQFSTIALLSASLTVLVSLSACNTSTPPDPLNEEALVADAMATEIQASPAADQLNIRSQSQANPLLQRPASSLPLPDKKVWPLPITGSEKYANINDNKTVQTASEPVSTFSIDVDTGAYSNVRRFLNSGSLPPSDAVRIEEMLNYFTYDYSNDATEEQPFSVVTEIGPTPWNADTRLLHIGLQGYMPAAAAETASNLVFLIDVSGSMNSQDKLGLLKSSMSMLTRELDKNDTVSIVVYAGSSGAVLEPTPGNEQQAIERALTRLEAGGSTNGAAGIELAYQLANENYKKDGINRVILATDGDFNVGTSNTASLIELIEEKRRAGIALTTLGFGTGNYNDHLMEQLADAGNGNHAYIDTLSEARKVLVDELTATLLTIARDVKIQIEFNPATVSEYRLIGYSNRILANEDFNNDKVDAGDIGAGHSVTALYEIALKGGNGERHIPNRYGAVGKPDGNENLDELAELRLRYKKTGNEDSNLIRQIISADSVNETLEGTSDNFRFSASVAGFGQLLRDNSRLDDFGFDHARDLASSARSLDTFGYRSEYLRLLDLAQSLDKLQRAANNLPDGRNTIDEQG